MTELYFIDVLGAWLGIFITFCILSFLYKDNPFYKAAEHLFVGVSIGYLMSQQYYNTLQPKLVLALADGKWLALVPLALFGAMIVKLVSRKFAWVGRYPLAFVVALFAGIQINAVAQAELGAQIDRAMSDLDSHKVEINAADPAALGKLPGVTPAIARKIVEQRQVDPIDDMGELAAIPSLNDAERAQLAENRGSIAGLDAQASFSKDGKGGRYWFGIMSNILLLAGTLASLLYFYFSLAHKGIVGKVSRFGVWVMMIGFGASFGYTVQGRIALAIGRAQDVMGSNQTAADAAQIHGPIASLIAAAIVVAGIVFWELRNKRLAAASGGGTPGAPPAGGTQ